MLPEGFVLFVFVLVCAHALDASRVHLVDRAPSGTLLFRTGEPTTNGTFAHADLLAAMRIAAARHNVTVGPSLYLVDVNLLELERGDIGRERAYWAAHPSQGVFVHRPIFGSLLNPASVPEAERVAMAKRLPHWSHDQLPTLVSELRQWVFNGTYPGPAAVFVHCEAGEDRTGEVIGSYSIRWLQMSFAKALAVDNHIESRTIQCPSAYEFAWV